MVEYNRALNHAIIAIKKRKLELPTTLCPEYEVLTKVIRDLVELKKC
jgi:hypothetical protein